MISGMNEFNITKDEIVDVLRVVLLTAGMPAFNKGMRILDEIEKINYFIYLFFKTQSLYITKV